MAYTPINWQTGDTITAEKLNRCDNGWGMESTQLFSGSLSVTQDEEPVETSISASAFSSATNATVSIDGTEYTCEGFDDGGFWTFGAHYGDFSTYPFSFYAEGESVYFVHQSAGTYLVGFSAVSYELSDGFNNAVEKAATTILPLRVKIGVTTWREVSNAIAGGRIAYVCGAANIEYVTRIQEFSVNCITTSGANTVITTYYASDADSPLYTN